ncbi:hypothetical protein ID866_1394 [Astraeus odoratus]|nr:hypothetical protein ID866_1394 [Astraeus odoratus]
MTSEDTQINSFLTWFQSNGGTVDLRVMGITDFPGSGRGAVALCDIPADYTLFALPRTLTLSTRTSPLPHLFGIDKWRAHKLHKGWSGLILCMMWEDAFAHEGCVGTPGAGQWSPYMRTLPTAFDTPMFWDEDDLQELKGTGVVDKIGREDAERAYHETLVPAIKTAPLLFPSAHLPKWYTLGAYHRAGSRILSRSFTVSKWADEDVVEHGSDADDDAGAGNRDSRGEAENNHLDDTDKLANTSLGSAMDVDESASCAVSDAQRNDDHDSVDEDEDDPSDIAMVPMADLLNARWGSENFNTYGDLPNSDLLRRYGYVDLVPLDAEAEKAVGVSLRSLGNPSDVVELRADLVVDVVREWRESKGEKEDISERIEWWLDEGGDDTFTLPCPSTSAPYQLPRELMSITRLLLLSKIDFETTRIKGKIPKSKQSEKDVLGVLADVLRRREEVYAGGSIDFTNSTAY